MIQDIAPSSIYIEYESLKPELSDICLVFKDDTVLVKTMGGNICFPTCGMLGIKSARYLFEISGIRYFLCSSTNVSIYGFMYEKVRALRLLQPKQSVFALMTGYHLYTWYKNNTYCGRCGKRLEHDEQLRAMNCPACGNQIFPRISPAVIIAVTNEDSLLLTRYKGRSSGFALIAGFCEIGETLEDTVRREVMEEVGLEVGRITYYKSQPWGVDSNLLVGFFARLKGKSSIVLEENELSFAQWYRRDEIGTESDGISLTSEMIAEFKNGYNG